MKLQGVQDQPNVFLFWCLGCHEAHQVVVKTPGYQGTSWEWNGSLERPTFSPSLLIRSGHYSGLGNSKECWCTYNAERPDNPSPFTCFVCHSFVVDGKIQYLTDCTHAFAGQTVEIPDWDSGK